MNITIKKKLTVVLGAFMLAITALFVPVASVSAQDCDTTNIGSNENATQNGINCAHGNGTPVELFGGPDSIFTTVVNILLFIIGAICVIMLIWGGIRYTTSAGNAASVTAAKNTIMYAIIGLVIAFLAFAIVNWVLVAITPGA